MCGSAGSESPYYTIDNYTNDIAVIVNLRAQVRENDAKRSPSIRIDDD